MEEIFRRAAQAVLREIEENQCFEDDNRPRGPSRALTSGHAPTNFVAGDTHFLDFQDLLVSICGNERKEMVFVDLGCGKGEAVAAALLLNHHSHTNTIREVVGIDLMHFQLDECRRLCKNIDLIISQQSCPAFPLPKVTILEEDFTLVDWSFADIVYVCATVFSETLLTLLHQHFLKLKPGSKVMLLDREMVEGPWKLIEERDLPTSWGQGHCFVYEKLHS